MSELLNGLAQEWWIWLSQITLQSSLLIALVLTVDFLVRRRAWPQFRLALYLLILAKLTLPPSFSSPFSLTAPILKNSPQVSQTTLGLISSGPELSLEERVPPDIGVPITGQIVESLRGHPIAVAGSFLEVEPESLAVSVQGWLMLLWIGGLIALTASLLVRHKRLTAKLTGRRVIRTGPLAAELRKVTRLAGLRQVPRLVVADDVPSPAVLGLFHPVVVMPSEWPSDLSEKDLRNTLLHELTHIKRADLLLQHVVRLLQIVYWFNPLVWLVGRRIHHLVELCCDATVCRMIGGEVKEYRRTILRAAGSLFLARRGESYTQLGMLELRNRIGERLRWLEKDQLKYRKARLAVTAAITTVMITSILPMAWTMVPADVTLPKGFTLVLEETFSPFDQPIRYASHLQTRFQTQEGIFREFRVVRNRDNDDLLVWPMGPPSERPSPLTGYDGSPEANPRFLGEDNVMGYKTLVFGYEYTAEEYSEKHRAPALQNTCVKSVTITDAGIHRQEPLKIELGTPAEEAFLELPGMDPSDESYLEEVEKAYRQVRSLIEGYWDELSETALERDDHTRKRLPAEEPLGQRLPVEPIRYSFDGGVRARFGPDGSLYFIKKPTGEIHQCSPDGQVVASYFLGDRQQFIDTSYFGLDSTGRVHALLTQPVKFPLQLDRRPLSWSVRCFETPELYTDVALSTGGEGFAPSAFGIDGREYYYVLASREDSMVILRFLPDGSLDSRVPIRHVDREISPTGRRLAHSAFGSQMVVLPTGEVYLLVKLWIQESGVDRLSARLYRVDLESRLVEAISLAVPSPGARLGGIHQAGEVLALEWKEDGKFYGFGRRHRGTGVSARSRLTLFDGRVQLPLGTVPGAIRAVCQEKALVSAPERDPERTPLSLVRFHSSVLSGTDTIG